MVNAPRTLIFSITLLLTAGLAQSCSQQRAQSSEIHAAKATPPHVEPPTVTDDKARDFPGLHNVVAYHQNYYSGSVPEGEAGFDTLAGMGVRTIISVDGAEPELAPAKARGIRYIHLPIGYNGFDEQRKLELVRATRDALKVGAVYIHCHHGKHRSAGAAAVVAASMGWMSPSEATERMKVSGTAPNYTGLFACAASAGVLGANVIDAVPATFPEVSHPAGFVKSMLVIDEVSDQLKIIEKAGWKAPADHPDLVPAAEAGRLADALRVLAQGDRAKTGPSGLAEGLADNGARAQTLEDMLLAGGADAKALSEQFKALQTSCKDCHARFRD